MEDCMNRFERSTIILSLIEELRKKGSWCGDTHIQKAVFFLQELFGVSAGFGFILYKHGPFSFDLRTEIRAMQADRFLTLEPTPPYGVSLNRIKKGEDLMRDFSDFLNAYDIQIGFVAEKIGDMWVSNLEKLSTALYVTREQQKKDVEFRAKYMHDLKPHITLTDARSFIKKIDVLVEESKTV